MPTNIEILNPDYSSGPGLDGYNILIDEPLGVNDDASCGGFTIGIEDLLPSMEGNAGKYLYTNGSIAYWKSASAMGFDDSVDYTTYMPFIGDITFTYTGDNVTKITTVNTIGTKIVDFTYTGDEVSQIDIDNYGEASRVITFTKDGEGIITQIHIN